MAGCTNLDACNYDELATDDDDSCILIGDTCDDEDDNTINDTIDENCECVGGRRRCGRNAMGVDFAPFTGNGCAASDLVIGMGSRWTDHGGDDVHGQNRGNPSTVWLDQSGCQCISVWCVHRDIDQWVGRVALKRFVVTNDLWTCCVGLDLNLA